MLAIKKLTLLTLVVLMALGITACGNQNDSVDTLAVLVEVQPVEKTLQQSYRELSATLEPLEEAAIAFEVGGRILDLLMKEGDRVNQGTVLARLDSSDYALELAAATAQRRQQEANLEQIETGATSFERAQSEAMLEKARANYEKSKADFERMEVLYESGALSRSDFEIGQTRYIAAKNDYEIALQSHNNILTGARSEVRDMNRAVLDQTIAREERARLAYEKTQLRAPFAGTVISRLTSEGQLVSAGTPIYRIGKIDQLKAVLSVPDREIQQWQVGETVTLTLYGEERKGTVRFIYPATHASAGTIGVEVWLSNLELDWYAGQVVKVFKALETREAIWVPVQAVVRRGEEPYVFVYEEGRAVKRIVQIGNLFNDHYAIEGGLTETDQVIITRVDQLFDGDEVVPLEQAGEES
ncbi:efflux RND transporter periplasmic adaptor subunit [Heliorestis convoluta]|uniref:RND transporter, hydrophobe/amphiphile efflux-1 (HAE1) family, MFP subunit MdtA n=1 Tax=Heliorestis convoluta TaxID=356322 RepID=A0A5Q2N254_9FIRM|nr:efflux RND transporter periplasmic adaptor subunit [Heliorestis convoluta]QGG48381.1 RND transporter, hydrophobe/amphiphile efflux-1 (HAE1) family, MFP subunit MdtA [Heliorestis convoluta]